MIKQQNIQQLFPSLQKQSYYTLQRVYENNALQQFHVLVQQIKTKFPIPDQINIVQFPTQENVLERNYLGYWADGLMEREGIYEYDTLVLKGNWKGNQLQTIDKVRVSLNQFPQQHNLKEIYEDEEAKTQLADEPDQDVIGNQFQAEILELIMVQFKIFLITLVIMRCIVQFDLLSLLDQGLQYQSLDASHRQNNSSVAIQTESKKKFLPTLALHKKTPIQYSSSVDHQQNGNNKFKFDSFSNSPNTRGTDQSNKSNRQQNQKKPNRSVQCRGRRNKQVLLSKKEQNIWSIKMNKLKLIPAKYTKLRNHEIVSEIKQFLYPPIWKHHHNQYDILMLDTLFVNIILVLFDHFQVINQIYLELVNHLFNKLSRID